MRDSDSDLFERLRELVKDAAKLLSHAEEAARHQAAGDLQGVASVVGLMHYPLKHVEAEVDGILERLASSYGVRPGSDE